MRVRVRVRVRETDSGECTWNQIERLTKDSGDSDCDRSTGNSLEEKQSMKIDRCSLRMLSCLMTSIHVGRKILKGVRVRVRVRV